MDGNCSAEVQYNRAVDVFSLALIIYTTYGGRVQDLYSPYLQKGGLPLEVDLIMNIKMKRKDLALQVKRLQECTERVFEIICKGLATEPEDRPTVQDILHAVKEDVSITPCVRCNDCDVHQ